jgi:hypothetical protein
MLLFASTLKKMGLDISKMLTPRRALFYGIIQGNTVHHSVHWYCQLPLG